MVIEAANGSPAEELADGIDAQVLEVHAYAAGQDCVAVADRAAGRWGNRLAALLVNAVPSLPHGRVGGVHRGVGGGRGCDGTQCRRP